MRLFRLGIALLFMFCAKAEEKVIRVLVVTGGHDYDTGFYSLFFGYPDIKWDHKIHYGASEGYVRDMASRYDVVVLYDMLNGKPEVRNTQNLFEFVRAGGGVVALHHVLAAFDSRKDFHDLIGGEYIWKAREDLPASTYRFDVDMRVHVADRRHPVTSGITDFDIHDEAYGALWVSPNAHVLLTTDHPASNKAIAWITPNETARVVTIQLGHGEEAFANASYRKLVVQAIRWAAKSPS
jgi:type 1 glutamine amidotransferase